MSPALSVEICALAGVFSQDPTSIKPFEWQELFQQWQNWLTRLQEGIPKGCLVLSPPSLNPAQARQCTAIASTDQ